MQVGALRVAPPEARTSLASGVEANVDFLHREPRLTFLRNPLQGEGQEWKKETLVTARLS